MSRVIDGRSVIDKLRLAVEFLRLRKAYSNFNQTLLSESILLPSLIDEFSIQAALSARGFMAHHGQSPKYAGAGFVWIFVLGFVDR